VLRFVFIVEQVLRCLLFSLRYFGAELLAVALQQSGSDVLVLQEGLDGGLDVLGEEGLAGVHSAEVGF